jgi:hypothetical protein
MDRFSALKKSTKRGGVSHMARNNQRGRRNNNPEGRNQYSSSWMDSARERPMAAAATAAAAVGAGVFLWSRRNQITDQLSNLSDQISEWTSNMQSGSDQSGEFETADAGGGTTSSAATGSTSSRTSRSTGSRPTSTGGSNRSTRGMSETGGGNASLGAHSGTTGSGTGS